MRFLKRAGRALFVAVLFLGTAFVAGADDKMPVAGGRDDHRHSPVVIAGDIGQNSPLSAIERRAGAALDANIYVANPGSNGNRAVKKPSVTVYATTAIGNAAPIRTIAGANTQFDYPMGVFADVVHNAHNRFVASIEQGVNHASDLLVFSRTATGDTKPLMSVFGPATGLAYPSGLALDGAGAFSGTEKGTTTPKVSPLALTTVDKLIGFTLTKRPTATRPSSSSTFPSDPPMVPWTLTPQPGSGPIR